MALFSTIVVAVDLSEMSADVLRYAARLVATSPGARAVVVHVVPDTQAEAWIVDAVGTDFVQLQKDWARDAKRRVDKLIASTGLARTRFTAVVVGGRPAEAIVQHATTLNADAIVLGTHGYGPVKHLMLGSVAERVLRHAHCPVVTVPHKSLPMLARRQKTPRSAPRPRPLAS